MRLTVSIAALTSLIALAALGAASASASVPVDLRVASNDAGNLADVVQYVPTSTTVKTSSGPDCFNPPSSPAARATRSARRRCWERSGRRRRRSLRCSRCGSRTPTTRTSAALGVCQINEGDPAAVRFFFLKANHQSLQVGANLFTVQPGDELLAYRTPSDGFSTDEELDLSAPVRSAVGVPVSVNVRSYTSPFSSTGATVQARQGATVTGARRRRRPTIRQRRGHLPGSRHVRADGHRATQRHPEPDAVGLRRRQPGPELPARARPGDPRQRRGRDDQGHRRERHDQGRAAATTWSRPAPATTTSSPTAAAATRSSAAAADTVAKDNQDKVSKSCEIVNGKHSKQHKLQAATRSTRSTGSTRSAGTARSTRRASGGSEAEPQTGDRRGDRRRGGRRLRPRSRRRTTGTSTLTVTPGLRQAGVLQQTDSINESDTVLRVLDRNAEITTRYGGGFVQSIDGLEGAQSGGRSLDWFFYVNGIESPVGSAQYDLSGGDRIWWDYRDWTAAMRVPAVVGSWPEPFLHGFQATRWDAAVVCAGPRALLRSGRQSAGRRRACTPSPRPASMPPVRLITRIDVLVGNWSAVRADPDAGHARVASGSQRRLRPLRRRQAAAARAARTSRVSRPAASARAAGSSRRCDRATGRRPGW